MDKTNKIMVVDDEKMIRDLLKKILTNNGYKIITAKDGVDALQKLKTEEASLMISDIKMPRMNGFELLRHVKKNYPKMNIIMMTAYGDTYTVKNALTMGANEYITKPFRSQEISLIVERVFWYQQANPKDKKGFLRKV